MVNATSRTCRQPVISFGTEYGQLENGTKKDAVRLKQGRANTHRVYTCLTGTALAAGGPPVTCMRLSPFVSRRWPRTADAAARKLSRQPYPCTTKQGRPVCPPPFCREEETMGRCSGTVTRDDVDRKQVDVKGWRGRDKIGKKERRDGH